MAPVVNDDFRMFTWAGNGKRILVYPVDYDKQFKVTCTHPEELSDNKETLDNDDDDAAAIGKTLSYGNAEASHGTHETDLFGSIQPKNLLLNRPIHLQRLRPRRQTSPRTTRSRRFPHLEISRHGRHSQLEQQPYRASRRRMPSRFSVRLLRRFYGY